MSEEIKTPVDVTEPKDETVETPAEQTNPEGVNPAQAEPEIDYKVKFTESQKEALRIRQEKEKLEEEYEKIKAQAEQGANHGYDPDTIPGFEQLSDEEQKNLIAYTEGIKRKALEEIKKDPAYTFARETYNERKWESAFDKAADKFPELRESKDDFRKKYYNPNNVPENIDVIIEDLSKVYLFDRARELGAKEALEKAERIDIERQQAGDKTPVAKRSLEDWHKLAQSNPAQFAKLAKEFKADMESGKLK